MPKPFLVDWFASRTAYRKFDAEEGRAVAHQERLLSPLLLSMYNRPRAIINLQVLHDNVYALMGIK